MQMIGNEFNPSRVGDSHTAYPEFARTRGKDKTPEELNN